MMASARDREPGGWKGMGPGRISGTRSSSGMHSSNCNDRCALVCQRVTQAARGKRTGIHDDDPLRLIGDPGWRGFKCRRFHFIDDRKDLLI